MNKREFTFFENSKILKNTVFESYSIPPIEHVFKNKEQFSEESVYSSKMDISEKWIFKKNDITKKWIFTKVDLKKIDLKKVNISKKVDITKNGCLKKLTFQKVDIFEMWISNMIP